MLDPKIITYLKNNNWWFNDISEPYKLALCSIGLDLDSDISIFYLHAEDCSSFYSRNQELYQLCWFIINSDYQLLIESARSAYGLSSDYIPLNDLSNGTYFYNKKNGTVIFLDIGEIFSSCQKKWSDFNSFICWYFQIKI